MKYKILLLGSGELGKEFVIAAKRYGQFVVAVDSYPGAPAMQVADAFEVPLSFLMNPAHHRWHRYEHEGVVREWLSMPYQDGEHLRFVWGATAGMLRNFYRFLKA